ncbi:MAG TPA: type II CAAX endopeptidase family protein [Pyrinomonadaceae bacterium]|nr:type II CAAX endopeptidase family protein [Pyrinomonadaceae bacterium]
MDTPQTSFPGNISEGTLPASRPVNPDDPPWGIAGAVGVFIMAFVLMLVVQTVFLVLYVFKRGVPFTPDALAEFATKDISAIFIQIVSIIPAHLLTLGLAWLVVTRVGKYPFLQALGLESDSKPRFLLMFSICAGLAVLLLLLSFGLVKITGNPETALDKLIESSRATALATAFAATFTAPLVEEIVFRGVLYSALQRLTGAAAAVVIVALLFAGIHVPQYWGNYGVIGSILLLSFTLTTIRALTGKLLPCFFVHLVFNGIQSFLIVLNPYFERLSPEKSPAPGALVHAVLNLLHTAL